MKKVLFLIFLCAWIAGCSDSSSTFPSENPKESIQPIERADSLYVKILHYNGTDKIYELAAYQDSYLFNGELGDGDHYTIERNFYIDTVVFDVSPRFHQCKDSSSLTYKIDGKKVETVESKWGRQALSLPDEEKHTIEISAESTCNRTTVTFDIVPSENPGKIFKHVDRFYLSFSPRINSFSYKNGSLFFTIFPSVAPQYYEGDTTLSRCKLMSGDDSLIIPITFDKYKKRLGTLAHINADSTKLASFTDTRKDFSLTCALYYQSWKVPAKVDSVNYFQPFSVSFRKTIEAPYIGELNGKIDILRESDLLSYLVIIRAHKRGTDEVVHKIYYDYIQDTLRVGTNWYLPQDSLGCLVDIDSIYAYTLPYVLATPESYKIWDYLHSKYAISCLDGKWCSEDADMKQDFDTTLAKLFTKYDGMDPHTWMSAFAWERDPPGPCNLPKSSSSSKKAESSSSSAFEECTEDNLGKMDSMYVNQTVYYYVCYFQKWNDATDNEIYLKKSCTRKNHGEVVIDGRGLKYICASDWRLATIYDEETIDYTNPDIDYKTFTDNRNGKTYKIVDIGTQTWFAQNLSYDTDSITGASCKAAEPINCEKGGTLYLWTTAVALPQKYQNEKAKGLLEDPVQGICPEGWRIPNKKDWETLDIYVEKNKKANTVAEALKAKGAWNFGRFEQVWGRSEQITDEFGFSAVPAGTSAGDGDYFTRFWSTTESEVFQNGVFQYVLSDDVDSYIAEDINKRTPVSVRCIKNKE